MHKTAIIILAAGKGSRMGGDIPKPLIELDGKPFIVHLLDSVEESGVCDELAIVIGNQATLMKETLGPDYTYVLQAEQLGTGHAVKVCRDTLEGKVDSVIVLYADHPFVDSETINELAVINQKENTVMGMATITVPDFDDWRSAMYNYGRIKRDESGNVAAIVEKKDASDEELTIREVNPAFFCFDAAWLWENLETVRNQNAQGEYYLTDLVKIAFEQNRKIASMETHPRAAIGINTPAELKVAEELVD
jgi:bifunctional UDP-N-acetylglucosamine pyrophosphorylase/glucosamine-1-phosphate N-acetyltransferase